MSKLNQSQIHKVQAEAGELMVAIDHLRNKLKNADLDESEKAYIISKGKELKAQYDLLAPQPTLYNLTQVDEDDLVANLTVLILNLDESFNVGKGLTVPQIEQLAITIPQRYASLTLDDIALCFHRSKCGDYGQVFDRLDLNVVNGWLNQYLNERQQLHADSQQNRHFGSKEGMSYDPADVHSVKRVANDRGINTDDESHFQAFRAEVLTKKKD